jgi:hypothetical protein
MKNLLRSLFVAAVSFGSGTFNVAATEERPFKAEINGLAIGNPCGVVTDAVGTSAHFGAITQDGEYCGLGFVGPGLLHLVGQGSQTAANGDTITFTFDEIVDLNTVPFTADGTFVITGGTGRFTSATGGGTFHTVGLFMGDMFTLNIQYTGTITY